MARIAINGFGRIGRIFFRQAFFAEGGSASGGGAKGLDIVAINDLGNHDNLGYLLKYDTVYGRFAKDIKVDSGDLIVQGKRIKCFQVSDPAQLPWKELKIDIVIESTGVFETFADLKKHIEAGAKRVILTAPAKDPDSAFEKTVLMGVNEEELKKVKISSNASCTTNAVSPVVQVLSENPGIKKAILNTVHGYTATQNLVDGPAQGQDWRRGRAAAQNIVPSTTGAAKAVSRAIKELADKFDGIAMRVPVASGSIADITFVSKRKTSAEEINEILRKAEKEKRWQGILKTTQDQIVSSDILAEPYGAIVDLKFTKVIDGDLVKVLSWYDNEYGYVATLIKHVQKVAAILTTN